MTGKPPHRDALMPTDTPAVELQAGNVHLGVSQGQVKVDALMFSMGIGQQRKLRTK